MNNQNNNNNNILFFNDNFNNNQFVIFLNQNNNDNIIKIEKYHSKFYYYLSIFLLIFGFLIFGISSNKLYYKNNKLYIILIIIGFILFIIGCIYPYDTQINIDKINNIIIRKKISIFSCYCENCFYIKNFKLNNISKFTHLEKKNYFGNKYYEIIINYYNSKEEILLKFEKNMENDIKTLNEYITN